MKFERITILKIFTHLLTLFVFYTLFRILFLFFNYTQFNGLTFEQLPKLLWKGMRFDIATIFIINSIFILLAVLPLKNFRGNFYPTFLKWLFILLNSFFFLFEIADWIYFKYNHKRATAEVLHLISNKGDFLFLLPSFLKDYWYLFLLALAFIYSLIRIYNSIELKFRRKEALDKLFNQQKSYSKKGSLALHFLTIFLVSFIITIGVRGGFQYIPLSNRNAVGMIKNEYTPIILNTPFSIIKTYGKPRLYWVDYMSANDADKWVRPIKFYKKEEQGFRNKNVVFIIIESFSKEFTKLTPGPSYTPFLDSLMDYSLTFTNAYANSLHSADGIPAILSGTLSFIDESYTFSSYLNNKQDALPILLKSQNYRTAFFHGGTDGTMNFNSYASAAGFDYYFGRNAYNNNQDYDGNWGIYDEPFLQFFKKQLDTIQEPFLASVFTLSSHPPFSLPEKYQNSFPKGSLEIHPTIGYTDMALRKFFESASKSNWYKNTLFVIAPDHCSPLASNNFYAAGTGRYQIPLIFFSPSDNTLKGYNHKLIQQIDILPSVLDYLNFPDSFFSLGNSIFDKKASRFVGNKLSGVYHWIENDVQIFYAGNQALEAFKFPDDSLRKNSLLKDGNYSIPDSVQHLFEATLQVFNQTTLNNTQTKKSYLKSLTKNTTHP